MENTFNWKPADEASHDGREYLFAMFNGVFYEYYVAWWSGHDNVEYPWQASYNAFPEDYFDFYTEIKGPDVHYNERKIT